MKHFTSFFLILLFSVSCSVKNTKQKAALKDYKQFVTATLERAKSEKFTHTSHYQERPIDPKNYSKITIDTVEIYPVNADSSIYHYMPYNYWLKETAAKYYNKYDKHFLGSNNKLAQEYQRYKLAIDTLYSFKYEK